ncbi:hypothetical protein AU509_11670 [Lonsdalea britannica]|uniref:Uncharacterized protein n=1 Tax=Lonsdalea britannica TaxID=1082704 RepID=A0AAD0WJI5_9GAMM|nr:hypothetical protein [Lonsdalea britannica]AXW85879.1 hypothetical protein CKQ53_02045 [Lonsdalea britannica]OSM96225.1 hypothetical protein AU509_11670 [Lonsdalea britannica]OSN09091.1 hypothetical protein AU510_02840 [Lonsdalea britannica]
MKKILAIAVLLFSAGSATAATAPCRSLEWNLWVESELNILGQSQISVQIGSTTWQQAVESKLAAKSWPNKTSVLWCNAVEQRIAAKASSTAAK